MGIARKNGRVIGEVAKLTGIPKRELKYYIEQNLIRPTQRTESGYWSYSEEEIRMARLVALCRNLGFPVKAIRRILADPVSHWNNEVELQLARLKACKEHTEIQINLAQELKRLSVWDALQAYLDHRVEEDAEPAAAK